MTIKVGDHLPEATLFRMGAQGVDQVTISALTKGRRVVIFGLPGAYTGTCSTMHVPSFMRTAAQFKAKGVDEIICLATDTPHVMDAWAKSTGGAAAGITFLSDGMSAFTTAAGLEFSVPRIGFANRSKRYSAFVEDGVVTRFNPEPPDSQCEISAGETLLAQIS
jgi:glutaredoxin/glutathione-dependent peroxiredoxin